jgi:hypothetical protein
MALAGRGGASVDRPLEETTLFGLLDTGGSVGAGLSSAATSGAFSAGFGFALAAFLGAAFLVETTFLAAVAASASSAGFSASCGGLIRPSRLAFLRTRSAWASTMLDEWLFTPMPRSPQRSMISLLERFSSLASS